MQIPLLLLLLAGVLILLLRVEHLQHIMRAQRKGEQKLLMNIAVDLKTHLTVIKWYLEMLMSGQFGQLHISQLEFLKKIEEANERAIGLLGQTHDLSMPEESQVDQKTAPGGAV